MAMRRAASAFAGGALLLAPLAAVTPAAARHAARESPPSCKISLTAAADGSFAQAGYDSSPARLARLVGITRARFIAAARRLCAAGVLRPADLARFRDMVVQNGEGATEPIIYRDRPTGPFIFQYAFQDGEPPEARAFEQALRCWKSPEKPGCYED